MYKVAICDDEQKFHEKLMEKIISLNMITDNVEFVRFYSGEELLESDKKFDLLFLDIQMPGINGNETSIIFREYNEKCILVFCTNYQKPLTDNFKVFPFRYIMKDLHYDNLSKELPDILNEMMKRKRKHYVTITQDGAVTRVPIDSIMYFVVDGRQTKAVCSRHGSTIYFYGREKLKALYNELRTEDFVFAHSSYLVNMRNIVGVIKDTIVMENDDKVYISRTKSKEFNRRFTQFLNCKFRR